MNIICSYTIICRRFKYEMSILNILLTVLIVVSAIPLIFSLRKGFRSINWIEFYSTGKDAGFSFKEIGLLRKTAVINRHQKPSSLFWSLDVLDKSIAGIHKKKGDGEKSG